MLTTSGLSQVATSRQIKSLAKADPPGLSTRSTMALTRSDCLASRRALTRVSLPTELLFAERARLAFARHDRSDGVDQGDPRMTAGGGGRLDAHHRFHQLHEAAETGIIGIELLLAVLAVDDHFFGIQAFFQAGDQFVFIANAIDQFCLFGARA